MAKFEIFPRSADLRKVPAEELRKESRSSCGCRLGLEGLPAKPSTPDKHQESRLHHIRTHFTCTPLLGGGCISNHTYDDY
jgi:hypothetical protein